MVRAYQWLFVSRIKAMTLVLHRNYTIFVSFTDLHQTPKLQRKKWEGNFMRLGEWIKLFANFAAAVANLIQTKRQKVILHPAFNWQRQGLYHTILYWVWGKVATKQSRNDLAWGTAHHAYIENTNLIYIYGTSPFSSQRCHLAQAPDQAPFILKPIFATLAYMPQSDFIFNFVWISWSHCYTH